MQNSNQINKMGQKPGNPNPNILRLDDMEYDLTGAPDELRNVVGFLTRVNEDEITARYELHKISLAKNQVILDLKSSLKKHNIIAKPVSK